jgi:hypothetical protein
MKTLPMLKALRDTVLAVLVAGLIACANGCKTAGSTLVMHEVPGANTGLHRTLAVAVSTKDLDFAPSQVSALAGFTAAKLDVSGKFGNVCVAQEGVAPTNNLRLKVVVELFVDGEQSLADPGSHEGSIDASATLTDLAAGEILAAASFHSHAGSGGFPGLSHAPRTVDAVEALSRQIADFLTRPSAPIDAGKTNAGYQEYLASLPPLARDQSRLWFYRAHRALGPRITSVIKLDGVDVGAAGDGTFFCVRVAPGSHTITQTTGTKTSNALVTAAPDAETFVSVKDKPVLVPETQARKEILGLRLSGR